MDKHSLDSYSKQRIRNESQVWALIAIKKTSNSVSDQEKRLLIVINDSKLRKFVENS